MARFRVVNEYWICSGADCEGCEPVTRLQNHDSAVAWLRACKTDSGVILGLRRLCREMESSPGRALSDDQVIDQIAWAIHKNRLRVCRLRAAKEALGGGDAPKEKEEQRGEHIPAAGSKVKKTWVEFAVVDMEGNPVANKKFLVMLPDGSLHEGMLDRSGVVRFNNIDPDTCVFSLPELDQDAWERTS